MRRGFTWGFGTFGENLELVRWMRAYNDDARRRRKIHFYRIDISLGGPQGSTPTPSAIDAASASDYAWATRNVIVAQQGDRVRRFETPPEAGGGIPAGAWREMSVRDFAMADNARWALEREGPGGRVLVFAGGSSTRSHHHLAIHFTTSPLHHFTTSSLHPLAPTPAQCAGMSGAVRSIACDSA